MDKTTRDQIMRMHEADLDVRLPMIEEIRKSEGGLLGFLRNETFKPIIDKANQLDAQNSATVIAIVDRVGWPTAQMVGAEAADAWAHLVSQRVSAAALDHLLPHLQAAADRGQVPDATVASVEDRADVLSGRPQRFGTQWTQQPDGPYVPYPMDDPVKVDERRANLGLSSLAEHAAMFQVVWGSTQD